MGKLEATIRSIRHNLILLVGSCHVNIFGCVIIIVDIANLNISRQFGHEKKSGVEGG